LVDVTIECHPWSAAARTIWAKSDRADRARWMPLIQHLADTEAVATLLWDRWLARPVRDRIDAALPAGARDGRALLRLLAGVHDIGKATPPFALQVPELAGAMAAAGFTMPRPVDAPARSAPHATTGHIILTDWLASHAPSHRRESATIADVVGGHHGLPARDIQPIRERADMFIGTTDPWSTTRTEIIDFFAARSGATDLVSTWCDVGLDMPTRMLLTGTLIVADWIASDSVLFPYSSDLVDTTQRAEGALRALGIEGHWRPRRHASSSSALHSRFPAIVGHPPRPLQEMALDLAETEDGPCLMVIEAPMGVGKTEAALLAAERLGHATGADGVFVGLPTMATSNAMFSRVAAWSSTFPEHQSIHLAHGKAALNEEYDGLLHGGSIRAVYDDADPAEGEVTAVAWLSGRKRGMLANIVVGTVDQALFMALASRHVVLRHVGLGSKVVIVDEVHAADDHMRVFLCSALEWLGAFGTPVLLLSATLPPAQRCELVDAYRRGLGSKAGDDADGDTAPYPAITVVSNSGVRSHNVPHGDPGAAVGLRVIGATPMDIADHVISTLDQGGCVGVILNTVTRAQATAEILRTRFGDDVILVHSRLLARERADREDRLRGLLGPPGAQTHRPDRLIVVGTQVLEQSLDVDFDAMITDIAPVDLVLQRMGRLHRHVRDDRPTPFHDPTVRVSGITDWGPEGPVFDRGVSAVYGEARLLRSAAALGLISATARSTVHIPEDIRDMVDRAYETAPNVPPKWLDRAVAADDELRQSIERSTTHARAFCLGSVPAARRAMSDFFPAPTEEEGRGGATVRDGDDGVEVIVVMRDEAGLRPPPGLYWPLDLPLPEQTAPPDRVARKLLGATVKLPARMCRHWLVDDVLAALRPPRGWTRSPWLNDLPVLVLDVAGAATVAGFQVTYDEWAGLRVEGTGRR